MVPDKLIGGGDCLERDAWYLQGEGLLEPPSSSTFCDGHFNRCRRCSGKSWLFPRFAPAGQLLDAKKGSFQAFNLHSPISSLLLTLVHLEIMRCANRTGLSQRQCHCISAKYSTGIRDVSAPWLPTADLPANPPSHIKSRLWLISLAHTLL